MQRKQATLIKVTPKNSYQDVTAFISSAKSEQKGNTGFHGYILPKTNPLVEILALLALKRTDLEKC